MTGIDGQHVGDPEGDDERVDIDARAERADEHPERGGVEHPVEGGPEQHPPEQLPVLDELVEALGDPGSTARPFVVDVEAPRHPAGSPVPASAPSISPNTSAAATPMTMIPTTATEP